MELGVSILLIWYLNLVVSKHVEMLQLFFSTGSKMTTFLESQIANFRNIIIDFLNNDWKCTFISIYQRLHQIQCHMLFLCSSLKVFCLFFLLCFLFACFCSLFLSNLFKTYRKNIDKARYQVFNILLLLAINTKAVFFTYSKQKIAILCSFVTFHILKILCFFGDVSFSYWNGIILLVYIF